MAAAIDKTKNFTLNNDWQEVSVGLVSIVLVSGGAYWAYNATSPPPDATKLRDFVLITGEPGAANYSYGGTQSTYCRIAGPDSASGNEASTGLGSRIEISVTPIL